MFEIKKIQSIVLLLLTATLSGCSSVILNPKGLIAADEKQIIIVSALLMLTVVVPVIFLTFFFSWRYRESNTKSSYLPNWDNNIWIEIVCWSVPLVIIVILGGITWRSSHQLDPYQPLSSPVKPVIIQAVSLEWRWLFIYPEENIATINYVQLPVNRPVRFIITAEGPMNSFQIPALGGQIYAMAGMQSKLNLIANAQGDFRGVSANFTGEGFSDMKFFAHVGSEEEFDQWVKTVKQSNNILTINNYSQLIKPNKNNEVQYFSAVSNNLFMSIVMKYMLPIKQICSTNNVIV